MSKMKTTEAKKTVEEPKVFLDENANVSVGVVTESFTTKEKVSVGAGHATKNKIEKRQVIKIQDMNNSSRIFYLNEKADAKELGEALKAILFK